VTVRDARTDTQNIAATDHRARSTARRAHEIADLACLPVEVSGVILRTLTWRAMLLSAMTPPKSAEP
jgi:hypothetical protein